MIVLAFFSMTFTHIILCGQKVRVSGGGWGNPRNKLALQIIARLLSTHKIFYKSPMTPGGTWIIKSVEATFFLLTQHQSFLAYWPFSVLI